MPAPRWSVVVPVRGPASDLPKLLAALARQTYPTSQFELRLVDDGSPEPVRLPGPTAFSATLIRQSPAGPGPARNRGVQQARGEWIAFTAADCEPSPNWLTALDAASRRMPGFALGGTVQCGLPLSSPTLTSHLVVKHLERRLNRDPANAQFFTPNNLALPAVAFRDVSGFGDSYTIGTGEDRDFCARWRNSGRRLAAAPDAVVIHTHPLTTMGLFRQQYRYGRGSGMHRVAQRRLGKPVRFESLSFYLGSLLVPWREDPPPRNPWAVAALMGASQFLNALGVMRQTLTPPGDGPA